MALSEIDAKQIQKISNVTGTVPTMGVSPDYTDGTWSTEDIYRGEFFLNDPDGRLWIGTVNGPIEIGAGIWSRVGEDIVAVENAITSPLIYPNILPPADAVSDLGSSALKWNDLYVGAISYGNEGTKWMFKEIEIGDWNMNYSAAGSDTVSVAHGLSATEWKTARDFGAIIRNDLDTEYSDFTSKDTAANGQMNFYIESTNFVLYHRPNFNTTNYDATSYNRGWITFMYQPD